MITKQCVICGKPFQVYPSEQDRQCCSKKCGAALRAKHGKAGGSPWSQAAKSRRAADQQILDQLAGIQAAGVQAALNLPSGQKGPQNRESLVWILIDPAGGYHTAVNLKDWARKNRAQFFPDTMPEDDAVKRIAAGFQAIATTLRRGCQKNGRPAMTYKGWRLAEPPRPKKPEDDEHDNHL